MRQSPGFSVAPCLETVTLVPASSETRPAIPLRSPLTRERLDGTVVDIEFLLIAVIQGLALTTLAVESETVIGEGQWIYLPYIAAAFVLMLNFWSLAIIHSISFISWPFDLVHTLLYLLVAFIEVVAFTQITHPEKWFVLMFVFFAVSYGLYAWDAKVIRDKRRAFEDTPARTKLYEHMVGRQRMEMWLMMPGAIVFHGAIVAVLWLAPGLILDNDRHVLVVTLQLLFGLAYLASAVTNFSTREKLLGACIEDPP